MKSDAAIRILDMKKSFKKGSEVIHVLNGVDLEVKNNECIAIVGASGSGKSTLLHLLGGLEKPDSGCIYYGDKDICRMKDLDISHIRNKNIGFIFQFHFLLLEFTALENVMMPAVISSGTRKESRDRALDLLETVGLKDRITHKPGEMSGGEQQRVAVARALMMSPKVILADEPTGDLDPQTGIKMIDLFMELKQKLGITMIAVTHNMELARSMDRVLVLRGGHLEPHSV